MYATIKIDTQKVALTTVMFVFLSVSFLNKEFSSLFVLISCVFGVLFTSFKMDKSILILLLPLVVAMAFGLSGVFQFVSIDVVRDVWYFSKAIPALVLGYLLASYIKDINVIFIIIIVIALINALLHLYVFFISDIYLSDSVQLIRNVAGRGDFFVVLAIAVIFLNSYCSNRLLRMKKRYISIIALILFASLVLYFSRALWLSFIVFVYFIFFRLKGKKFIASVSLVILTVSVISVMYIGGADKLQGGFIGKAMNSIDEVFISDYSDIQSIHNNWRGYESYMAQQTYLDGSFLQLLFGHGFGKKIDLGLYMKLGDEYYRFIPITHNGFYYILVKTGVVGLALYIMFFINTFNLINKVSNNKAEIAFVIISLLKSMLVSMFLLTFFIGGFMNISFMPIILLIALFISYMKNNSMIFMTHNVARAS